MQKRIIVCAGHGGGDNGAVGQGTTEANETVDIANRVVRMLRDTGAFEVQLVPHELNLHPSIQWVNARWRDINDGLAIEIHKNSGGGTGSEVWTPSYPDDEIRSVAGAIAGGLARATGLPNRGVKEAQHNRWGRLGWCDDTNTYACLIEAGFIDRDPVGAAMNEKYARGIVDGIMNKFGVQPKPPAPVSRPVPDAYKMSEKKKVVANLDVVKLWDLATNPHYKAVKEFKRGEVIDVVARIDFNGNVYYQTAYSFGRNKWAINSADVAEYVEPAQKEVNTDTKSPAPVSGRAIGEPVSELEKKHTALEARVGVLERLVKSIMEFLSGLFKNFKK